jgi:cytochrome c2
VLRIWDLASGREIANGVGGRAHTASWDDGSRGAQLYRKCSACHTLGEDGGNRAGPTLYGLFGRPFGQISGYRYSEALRNSDLVWNETTIDALFAEGPAEYVPGSKMPLQRMPNPEWRPSPLQRRLCYKNAPNPACQGRDDMKAFLAGCAAAVVIAVAAHFALQALGLTSADVYSGGSVRL